VRGRIEAVLNWASARGLRDGDNPARWRGHLDRLLPNKSKVRRQEHLAAVPFAEVPVLMAKLRAMQVTPHVAQNDAETKTGKRRRSAIDRRTTRHAGYAVSQRKRKRIEECFGWLKTIALMRKLRHRGVCKVHWIFTLACAAYNLVRMRNMAAAVPAV